MSITFQLSGWYFLEELPSCSSCRMRQCVCSSKNKVKGRLQHDIIVSLFCWHYTKPLALNCISPKMTLQDIIIPTVDFDSYSSGVGRYFFQRGALVSCIMHILREANLIISTRECSGTLYVGLQHAVLPTNTKFQPLLLPTQAGMP